jgi:hypothetical protein
VQRWYAAVLCTGEPSTCSRCVGYRFYV